MEMKATEILASYKNASSKTKQIGILAELNACTRDDIIEILEQMGESVPKRKYVRKDKKIQEQELPQCKGCEYAKDDHPNSTEECHECVTSTWPDPEPTKKQWEEPELKALPEPREIPQSIKLVLYERLDVLDAKIGEYTQGKENAEKEYMEIVEFLKLK